MKLSLYRTQFLPECTKGNLYVDGSLECFTLEPPKMFVGLMNVPNKTCVLDGTYIVHRNAESRFGPNTPLLVGVPGRDEIELHPLNVPKETDGCIGVGAQWINGPEIGQARMAFAALTARLAAAWDSGEAVSITIKELFEAEDVPANG